MVPHLSDCPRGCDIGPQGVPEADGRLVLQTLDAEVNGCHGFPAVVVERQQDLGGQADELVPLAP